MTILLKKDGRLIIDADQPIEGVSLDNLAAILAGANDGDVIKYDASNGMWVSGAGGGSLPSVTSSDNGKVLGVVNAEWDTMAAPSSLPAVTASDKGKYLKANETTGDPEWASGGSSGGGVLVVTDTDGTLDKTAGEIMSAYTNGVVVVNIESDGYIDRAIIVDAHYNPDETNHYSFGVYMGSYVTYYAENSTDYPIMDA